MNSSDKTYKAKGYPAKHLNAAVMRLAGVSAGMLEPGWGGGLGSDEINLSQ